MHELEDFGKFDNLNFLFLDFFAFSNIYNPVPNISRKVKKSSKGRHLNQKILISVFKYFLSAIAKIFAGYAGLKVVSPCSFGIFLIFPNVPRS